MVGCFQTGTRLPRSAVCEVVVGVQERRHDALVLGGRDRARRVDEGTAGAQRGGARGEDPRLQLGEHGRPSGLAPARVRARGERAEIAARRVDEHAVERRARLWLGGVGRAVRRRCPRPYERRSGAAPRRGQRGARRRRRRRGCPSGRRGGWSCRRARRTGRARARRARARAPARRPSRRATAASAGPSCHSGAAKTSNGASSTSASGRPSGMRVGTGRRAASASGAIFSVLARTTASAGSLSAAISARASAAPSASNHSVRDPLGMRVARAPPAPAVVSGSASTSARASRAARRRTALTRPRAARRVGLGQLDRLADGGVRGHAVQERQLEDAEPQRGQHRRVELGGRPAGQRDDHVVERGDALDGPVGELGGQRRGRARPAVAAAPRRAARDRPTRPARTRAARPRTRTPARARRPGWGLAPDGRSCFCMPAFTRARFFCLALSVAGRSLCRAWMRSEAAPHDRRLRSASYRGPVSGPILKVESGLFAALFVDARTFVQKSSSGINLFRKG